MFNLSKFSNFSSLSDSREDYYTPYVCKHGREFQCDDCDDILDSDGGIDKCLNCGKYKSGNQLDQDQVCRIECKNPNEY